MKKFTIRTNHTAGLLDLLIKHEPHEIADIVTIAHCDIFACINAHVGQEFSHSIFLMRHLRVRDNGFARHSIHPAEQQFVRSIYVSRFSCFAILGPRGSASRRRSVSV